MACEPRVVGPPEVHDSTVSAVEFAGMELRVALEPLDGAPLEFRFEGVSELESVDPVGMMLYSIHAEQVQTGWRFVFVNWDDDDTRSLVFSANDGYWRAVGNPAWRSV